METQVAPVGSEILPRLIRNLRGGNGSLGLRALRVRQARVCVIELKLGLPTVGKSQRSPKLSPSCHLHNLHWRLQDTVPNVLELLRHLVRSAATEADETVGVSEGGAQGGLGLPALGALSPVELLRNLPLLVVRQRREHLAHVTIDYVLDGEVRRAVGQLVAPAQWGALLPQVHLQVGEEVDCEQARCQPAFF